MDALLTNTWFCSWQSLYPPNCKVEKKGSLVIDWKMACPMGAWQGVKWPNCCVRLMFLFCQKYTSYYGYAIMSFQHNRYKLTPKLCSLYLFVKGWATCVWLRCVATVPLFSPSKAVIRVTASTQSIVSLCGPPAERQRNILIMHLSCDAPDNKIHFTSMDVITWDWK